MEKEMITDMSNYMGAAFIKYEDVAAAPRHEKIALVYEGDYDRPVLKFEGGDQFTLNKTNVRTLVRTYGKNPHNWVGQIVELYAGSTVYSGQEKQSVLVKPISQPRPSDKGGPSSPNGQRAEIDDDIPF